MAWFEVGCIGLLTTNTLAYRTFTDTTSREAHDLVFTTNMIMHLLWGLHNQHLFFNAVFYDKGTENEWRRSIPIILWWSLTGACGSGFYRNYYSLYYGVDDAVTKATVLVEWGSLAIIVLDLLDHLLREHEWGMAMRRSEYKGGKAN